MRRSRALLGLGLAAVLWAAACSPTAPARHTVEIRGLTFLPANVVLSAGDTVSWINHDLVPHTVTAADGSWDSGEIAPGETFTLAAQTAAPFVCRYHPTMAGSFTVR